MEIAASLRTWVAIAREPAWSATGELPLIALDEGLAIAVNRTAGRLVPGADFGFRKPCLLRGCYQLARNVLAACVRPDGRVDIDGGHALVVYDARNPAFRPGGEAEKQWAETVGALAHPGLLRRCSWQRLAAHLARTSEFAWLVDGLAAKYGIEPCFP